MFNGYKVLKATNNTTKEITYHVLKNNKWRADFIIKDDKLLIYNTQSDKPTNETIASFSIKDIKEKDYLVKATGILQDKDNLAMKAAKDLIDYHLRSIFNIVDVLEKDVDGMSINYYRLENGDFKTEFDLLRDPKKTHQTSSR